MTLEEHKAEVQRLERVMFDAQAEANLRPDPTGRLHDAHIAARDAWIIAMRARDMTAEYGPGNSTVYLNHNFTTIT